jgi:hypothetical protein
MNNLTEALKIADIHANRIQYAKKNLQHYFPITPEKVTALKIDEIAMFELFTNRFAKLQDLMGNKIFTLLLIASGEQADEMSFIDKINKLEKLKIIDSAQEWLMMRQVRHHLSHEYPEHPELTSQFLNQAYTLSEKILTLLNKIKLYVNNLPSLS